MKIIHKTKVQFLHGWELDTPQKKRLKEKYGFEGKGTNIKFDNTNFFCFRESWYCPKEFVATQMGKELENKGWRGILGGTHLPTIVIKFDDDEKGGIVAVAISTQLK